MGRREFYACAVSAKYVMTSSIQQTLYVIIRVIT